MIALCDHYNRDEKRAWMKQETLAKLTGYTRPTVNAALQALEDVHGLITSETRRYDDGRNAAKVYRLNTRVKEIDSGESRVNEAYTDKVNAVDTVRVKEIDNKNQEHRTVNQEPKKKRERKGHEFDPLTVDLPEKFDRDLFVGFCDVRLKKKSPMTAYALRLFLKKHGGLPKDELDARFEKAIVAGWLDLYPVDGNRRPQRAATKGGALSQYTERGL